MEQDKLVEILGAIVESVTNLTSALEQVIASQGLQEARIAMLEAAE